MLSQSLQQKMQQKLSPLQIQLMKLIEVPAALLEQRIKEEMVNNPVLEVDSEQGGRDNDEDDDEAKDEVPEEREDRDATIEEYLQMEETPAYKLQANNFSADDKPIEVQMTEGMSFYEHLEEQIGLQDLNEHQLEIAHYIIGNIDEDGYLRRSPQEIADDMSFSTNEEIADEEVEQVLKVVQQLDPAGVGASNLKECLLLQLRTRNLEDPINGLAYRIVNDCFDDFTNKRFDRILKRLRITDSEDMKDAIEEILRLNPKPGSAYSGTLVKAAQHIIPDFIVEYENNKLTFHLNRRSEPELRISSRYTDMLEGYVKNKDGQTREQKEAITFVRQKLDAAKWFIDAIKQRRNTLNLVMDAILKYQGDYFIDGDETKLKPMILKDIAKMTELDASTISRVSNSKYVQTPFGIYPLKYFFSEGIQSAEGEDVSSREVKSILAESVANEDKRNPLTDEKLMEILSAKSYNIARRTVAKYREQLGIPVARLRKEL
ncbi:MAG: RNA polymerase factor sigma-54 [Bacteroidales bacterium]|nr:RNA polymerase factor sigma-54 [Bacteroidales bacterium]